MSTYTAKPKEIEREWFLVDATNQPVGRVACTVAQLLRGKHKPTFAYHLDVGDHVVVINADKVVLTGNKKDELIYWHTLHPQGLRSRSRGKMLETEPERLLTKAIWGMLPKHKLGRQMLKRAKVYRGSVHPHSGQNPKKVEVGA